MIELRIVGAVKRHIQHARSQFLPVPNVTVETLRVDGPVVTGNIDHLIDVPGGIAHDLIDEWSHAAGSQVEH